MNITDQDSVRQLITIFKQSKSYPQLKKAIPSSYDPFYNQSNILSKSALVIRFWSFIEKLPRYVYPKSKIKSCIKKTISLPGTVYSNRNHESVLSTSDTSGYDVLIGYVNSNNDYKDLRVQGGGLKPQYIEQQNAENIFIGSYLDVGRFDGEPTQIAPTIVIELPKSILNTYTEDDMSKIINKHIAAGILPIVRYYDFTESVISKPPNIPTGLIPSDGALNISSDTTLSWNTVVDAVSYLVQVSTDSNFSNLVFSQVEVSNSCEVLLTGGTKYYFRVCSINEIGQSDWSSVNTFSTILNIPNIPQLISPANNSTDIGISPTLTWESVSNVLTYNLQLSTDLNFTSLILNKTGLTSANFNQTGLQGTTQYYWRVSATNTSGTSDWSQVGNFITIRTTPQMPVITSPLNNSVGISLSPTITWNAVSGTDSYGVQISTDPDFSNIIVDQTGINSNSLLCTTTLSQFTNYYIRINATNDKGSSDWSTFIVFTTTITSLATPTNISYSGNWGGYGNVLTWDPVPNALGYVVSAGNYKNENNAVDGVKVTEPKFIFTNFLSFSGPLYWSVQAYNGSILSDIGTLTSSDGHHS